MPHSVIGELVGTCLLILFGNGVVAGVVLEKTKSHNAGWIVIATGWAIAVLLGVAAALALGAPGELNPAVTLANVMRGERTVTDALFHVGAQFLGAILGATLVWLHYLPHWTETPSPDIKRACFCTAPAIRQTVPNVLSEVIGTFALLIGAFALGSAGVAGTSPASNIGPLFVAALVWGIGLSLGGTTGYAINPARDLGPRIAHAILPIAGKGESDWSYAWIPVVGPLLGAALAAVLWSALGA
jgi:glycerol uptake facilitator protein